MPLRIFLALVPLLLLSSLVWGDELTKDDPALSQAPTPLERMVGEHLVYDISFLWFDRLAEARLSLEAIEPAGRYRATLVAQTLGVAAWLTGERVQRYVSVMERTADGHLRSLVHESRIIKGKGKKRGARSKRYTFDYEKKQVRYQRVKDGKAYKEKTFPLQEGSEGIPPADILTAFYNFRIGFFGPLRVGGEYAIPAFDKDGTSRILIKILPPEERRNRPFFPAEGLLCRVTVDQEIFDTGDGAVYAWFDEEGRPLRGMVENVLGLGDVRGILRK